MPLEWRIFLIGAWLSGMIIYGLSYIMEALIIKRLLSHPVGGLFVSIGVSFILCLIFWYLVVWFPLFGLRETIGGLVLALLFFIPTIRRRLRARAGRYDDLASIFEGE